MRKLLILVLVLQVTLSGCVMQKAIEKIEDVVIDELFDSEIICLYGVNVILPNGYKENAGEKNGEYNFYNFYLGDDLYMMTYYFPNEFSMSFENYTMINTGYFLTNYVEKEKSQLTNRDTDNISVIQFTYEKSYEDSEYSGVVSYIEVAGGIMAIDIYRTDFQFSEDEKVVANEIINSISLNDVGFPEVGSTVYEIGDKEITLSDHWELRSTQTQGNFKITSFTYNPLSIMINVMWHSSGSKQTDEETKGYFAQATDVENLFETTIGEENGYYMIHYDIFENGYNNLGIAVSTSGAIYNIVILIADEDFSLPDEMYHKCAKLLEDSVSMK